MKVNIVMLCHNRNMLTHQALRTLYRNTPMEMFNLTVIDDESAVHISPIRREHKENFVCLRIQQSKGIIGQARNLGIYWSETYWGRGDYLYLSDNDMYFTPQWLETMLGIAYDCRSFTLLGGWNHPFMQPAGSPGPFGEYQVFEHDAVAGASQLIRWETWDKYKPFDAHAKGVGQSEDWAFCQKIIKAGGRVGSIYPRLVYNAGITNSFGSPSPGTDVMLEELREAKRQYPDLYWE